MAAVIAAVFDANVLVAGAGWRGDSHLCLVQMARRRVRVFSSAHILEETERICAALRADGSMPHDPQTVLNWFKGAAHLVNPSALGKPRSRDAKDDPVLGTALAARSRLIVTADADLLVLGKPFGIEIIRPRALLAKLQRPL